MSEVRRAEAVVGQAAWRAREDSIDQLERPARTRPAAQRHLALARSCRPRCRRGRAQLAQLAGAEHERPDRRAAAAEDEVVGAEPRELRASPPGSRTGSRPAPAAARSGPRVAASQLAQLVLRLGEREAAVQVDLERLGGDVARPARTRRPARRPAPAAAASRRWPGQLGDRLVQHLDVELEAERGDVAGLLGAEQVAGAADLEVAHRDREARRRARCGRRASRAARAPRASAPCASG